MCLFKQTQYIKLFRLFWFIWFWSYKKCDVIYNSFHIFRIYHKAPPNDPRSMWSSSVQSLTNLSSLHQTHNNVSHQKVLWRHTAIPTPISWRTHLQHDRGFHISSVLGKELDETDTKIEQTVKVLKEKRKEKASAEAIKMAGPMADAAPSQEIALPKKPMMQRIKDEIKHYWNGFRLLGVDFKISARLLWRVLHGHSLTRREYKQVETNPTTHNTLTFRDVKFFFLLLLL